jgi:hypothetical protein
MMATKPKEKKNRASYSNVVPASVSMTDAGPSNKDTISQVDTSTTQNSEKIRLRSGTTLEQKRTMEMSLELILEMMDRAIATSPEVELKMKDVNTSRNYLGLYGTKSENRKGIDLLQRKTQSW